MANVLSNWLSRMGRLISKKADKIADFFDPVFDEIKADALKLTSASMAVIVPAAIAALKSSNGDVGSALKSILPLVKGEMKKNGKTVADHAVTAVAAVILSAAQGAVSTAKDSDSL